MSSAKKSSSSFRFLPWLYRPRFGGGVSCDHRFFFGTAPLFEKWMELDGIG
jgi:hypothetical protein